MRIREKNINYKFFVLFSIAFLIGCGGGGSTSEPTTDSGALNFSISYQKTGNTHGAQAAALDCASEGIANVEAAIYDSGNAFLVGGGPWNCADGKGTIASVPAGSDRKIVILGKDNAERIVFRGEKSGIKVDAKSDNDAGTIECYAFVPILKAPADGSVVNPNAMGLLWSAVPGAAEYNIIVSTNEDLSAPLIDEPTTDTNFIPTDLTDNQTYYWQVLANDVQNHLGIGSPTWTFTIDSEHVNTPPEVHITSPADSSTFTIDEVIQFAGNSVDEEDGNLTGTSLAWASDIEGPIGEGESFSRLLSEGNHQITLTATDSGGVTAQQTIKIVINTEHVNEPPEATIIKPDHGSTFFANDEIQFSGIGSDKEDGEITGASLVWHSNVDGLIGMHDSFTLKTLSSGTHKITLTVTDSEGSVGIKSIAITVATGRLPDTGQTTSYTETFGEDCDYSINPPDFTKLSRYGNEISDDATNWSMVNDNVTGLTWEAKKPDSNIHDRSKTYYWRDAQDTFLSQLNSENFGGYSDWRLPTIKELFCILYRSKVTNFRVNKKYFTYTIPDYYWTSTLDPYSTGEYHSDLIWSVNFNAGYASKADNLETLYVRAVRGPISNMDLVDNNDGTVTNKSTGLMWQQITPKNENGDALELTWEQALVYCEEIELAGYDDWRLPNIIELQSIVDYSEDSPSINISIFPETVSSGYWSSTTWSHPSGNTDAWRIHFNIGSALPKHKESHRYHVRAVRGG